MATNLFAPLSEQTKKDVLVEFKAGKMQFRGDGSKMVDPDPRKGLVQLKQSQEDNLIHFVWKDRTTGTEETNLMLFPDDATFRKVEEAKARVYVLEWTSSDRKMFFWMQEPEDTKDKEHCDNINKFIFNPPQPASQGGGLGGLGDLEGLGLNQAQLLQLLQGAGGNPNALSSLLGLQGARPVRSPPRTTQASSTPSSQSRTAAQPAQTAPQISQNRPTQPTTTAATTSSSGTQQQNRSSNSRSAGVQLDTLQRIISELNVPQQAKGPSLVDIVNVDEIIASGLFENPEVVAKLAEFLPSTEGTKITAENLRENVRSPQFSQAVSMFNQALRSGQLTGIMSSFGLDPTIAGPSATIEDFLRALQNKAKEEKKEKK